MKEFDNFKKIKYVENNYKCSVCNGESLVHIGPTEECTHYLCADCGNIEEVSFEEIDNEALEKYYSKRNY